MNWKNLFLLLLIINIFAQFIVSDTENAIFFGGDSKAIKFVKALLRIYILCYPFIVIHLNEQVPQLPEIRVIQNEPVSTGAA